MADDICVCVVVVVESFSKLKEFLISLHFFFGESLGLATKKTFFLQQA